MTLSTRERSSTAEPAELAVATARDHLITVLLASWMTIGGFVDGYAHRNLDTLETFFTPWHGVLYSGYLAVAGWLLWVVVRNRSRAGSLAAAIPLGYGTSLAGVGVFFLGGVGDMLWHLAFGIEVSIDALLSPTHLLLLVGALLILSGPIRASWLEDSPQATDLRRLFAPILAVTMATAELGFFFQYMDGTSVTFMETAYRPGIEEGYFAVVAGVGSILITTLILMGGLLLIMRRWELPLGTGLVLFGGFGLLMESLEGFAYSRDLIAPIAAGLAADLLIIVLRPQAGRLGWLRGFVFLVPVIMWSVRFGVFETFADINWPVPVWTGVIVFSGLAAVGLSLLAFSFSRRETAP